MLFSDVPYVPGVQSAAKLRTAVAIMHSRFELANDPGLLKSFWDDQIARLSLPTGTPFDGVFLGPGINDLRPQCYAVQSHLRLYPNAKDKADVTALFTFLSEAADAIGKPPVIPVSSITVLPASVTGEAGTTKQLTPTVLPANATDKKVTYATSSAAVATVSASGLVTLVASGTATVTASAGGKSVSVPVSVKVPAGKNGATA